MISPTVKFKKLFEFKDLPHDWQISALCVDWNGKPLLLVEEGKPPAPPRTHPLDWQAQTNSLNAPPKAHHVFTFEKERPHAVTFEDSARILIAHVQRFGDGWLLAEDRGGDAVVYSSEGRRRNTLDLGDASNDLQTTPEGHIWVSYFDEAIYGSGIGSAGLACFDSSGKPVFKYFDLAQEQHLPFIDDCYALNVVNDHEVWLCFYAAFPLVKLRDFKLSAIWKDFGSIDHGFAVVGESVIFKRAYNLINDRRDQLFRRKIEDESEAEPLTAVDQDGAPLPARFDVSARASSLYVKTPSALYQMLSIE